MENVLFTLLDHPSLLPVLSRVHYLVFCFVLSGPLLVLLSFGGGCCIGCLQLTTSDNFFAIFKLFFEQRTLAWGEHIGRLQDLLIQVLSWISNLWKCKASTAFLFPMMAPAINIFTLLQKKHLSDLIYSFSFGQYIVCLSAIDGFWI